MGNRTQHNNSIRNYVFGPVFIIFAGQHFLAEAVVNYANYGAKQRYCSEYSEAAFESIFKTAPTKDELKRMMVMMMMMMVMMMMTQMYTSAPSRGDSNFLLQDDLDKIIQKKKDKTV